MVIECEATWCGHAENTPSSCTNGGDSDLCMYVYVSTTLLLGLVSGAGTHPHPLHIFVCLCFAFASLARWSTFVRLCGECRSRTPTMHPGSQERYMVIVVVVVVCTIDVHIPTVVPIPVAMSHPCKLSGDKSLQRFRVSVHLMHHAKCIRNSERNF